MTTWRAQTGILLVAGVYLVVSIVILGFIGVLVPHLRSALNDFTYPPQSAALRGFLALTLLVWIIVFGFLSGGVLWAESRLRMSQGTKRGIFFVLGIIAIFAAIIPPIGSSDFFDHMAFGRTFLVHRLNPYRVSPKTLDDPFIQSLPTFWTSQPSVHGPILNTLVGVPSLLLGRAATLRATIVVMKVLWLAAFTIFGVVFWRLLVAVRHPFPVTAVTAVFGNPVSVWLLLIDGNDEAFLLPFLTAAVLLLLRHRSFFTGVLLAAAAAGVKAPLAVVFPLFWRVLAVRLSRSASRMSVATFFLGFLGTGALLYLPFAGGNLSRALLYVNQSYADPMFFAPIPQLLYTLMTTLFPGFSTVSAQIAMVFSNLFFLLTAGAVLFRIRKGSCADTTILHGITATFLLLFLTRNVLMPWYMLWVIPTLFAALRHASHIAVSLAVLTVVLWLGIVVHPISGILVAEILALCIGLSLLGARVFGGTGVLRRLLHV